MINIPKGTKDVTADESYRWQYLEQKARETAGKFTALEVRTPVFEHTELFLRSIGDETDIVGKEMYTFLDKGNRSLTLKPEGTAGMVRSYVENAGNITLPLKTYYFTPVFRYERPQKWREREHHQFGVEFFGSSAAEFDAEVINLGAEFLSSVHADGLTLYINSIGCDSCRPSYNKALREFLAKNEDALCDTCRVRMKTNPLRALDCKVASCRAVLENAPLISDFLCDDCKLHFDALTKLLKKDGIKYIVDKRLVRGLDYYTKTVFEFKNNEGIALLAGGRYDNLVEQLGGKATPCAGFGCGLERLLGYLDESNIKIDRPMPDIYFAAQFDGAREYCRAAAFAARKAGLQSDYDCMNRSLKAQLKYADKRGFQYVAVIGESELASNEFSLKRMADGKTAPCTLSTVVKTLRSFS